MTYMNCMAGDKGAEVPKSSIEFVHNKPAVKEALDYYRKPGSSKAFTTAIQRAYQSVFKRGEPRKPSENETVGRISNTPRELPNTVNPDKPIVSAEKGGTQALRSFEEQFKNPKFIEVNGAKVKVIDLKPGHDEDIVPIFFGPGWAETTSTYRGSLKHIYDQNRRVISLDHPRRGGIPEKEDNIPRAELHKAQNTIAAIESAGIQKVDAIVHSEGAIYTAIAASKRPDLFRNIVFVSPGGLSSSDNLVKEITRFGSLSTRETASAALDVAYPVTKRIKQLADTINSNIKRRLGKNTREQSEEASKKTGWPVGREVPNPDTPRIHDIGVAKYIAANPARTIAEAQAIAKADIFKSIENLRELGMGISIIHGVNDPLEPMTATFRGAKEKGTEGHMPTDGYYSVRYGHNTLARDTRYVDAALDALKGLEYKRQKRMDK